MMAEIDRIPCNEVKTTEPNGESKVDPAPCPEVKTTEPNGESKVDPVPCPEAEITEPNGESKVDPVPCPEAKITESKIDRLPCHEVKITEPNGVSKIMKVPVVQELFQQLGDSVFPEGFTRATPDSAPPTPFPAPVIDLKKIQAGGGAEREAELRKLAVAAKDWGLFLVENHGIGEEVLEEFKNVVKEFFDLSYDEKKASVGSYSNFANTGYGRNYIKSDKQSLDWHDRLSMKPFPEDATNGLSVWPRVPPNFRRAAEKYVTGARKMCDALLQGLAESLSADKNSFLKYFDEKKSEFHVKVNYYPPCPRPDLALGIAPHSDGSALTVLTQFESSGGLQAYNYKDKNWMTIEWPVGGILINVGDLLQIMSNGEFVSPWHRVAAQGIERYSVAAFYTPPITTKIGPYTDVENGGKGGKGGSGYRKLVVEDYIKYFYKVNPTPTKETIKYAQIKIDVPAETEAN